VLNVSPRWDKFSEEIDISTDSSKPSRSYQYQEDCTVRSKGKENEMSNDTYDPTEVPEPSAELRELGDRMVGRSRLSGRVEGTTRFEWMEGGYF
jgi:hypothetical protein